MKPIAFQAFLPFTLMAAFSSSTHAAPPLSVVDEIHTVINGYEVNRSVHSHGMCRFLYAYRRADTVEAALSESWNSLPGQDELDFTLYFDDDALVVKTSLSGDVGEDIGRKMEAGTGIVIPINIGVKGEYAIDHDAIANNAIVHSPKNYNLVVSMHPFNLAMDTDRLSLMSVFARAEADGFEGEEYEIEHDAEYDGRTYLLVKRTRSKNGKSYHYYIDTARGFLPFVTEAYRSSGELHWRMLLLDVHEDEYGSYFPLHAQMHLPRTSDDGASFIDVREMKVTELDLDYKPGPGDLAITLPRTSQFWDGVDPNTSKSLYRDGEIDFPTISVEDIEGIYNQLQGLAVTRRAKESARVDVLQDEPIQRRSSRHLLLIINGALILLVGAIYLWIRRRKERSV